MVSIPAVIPAAANADIVRMIIMYLPEPQGADRRTAGGRAVTPDPGLASPWSDTVGRRESVAAPVAVLVAATTPSSAATAAAYAPGRPRLPGTRSEGVVVVVSPALLEVVGQHRAGDGGQTNPPQPQEHPERLFLLHDRVMGLQAVNEWYRPRTEPSRRLLAPHRTHLTGAPWR